MVAKSGLVSEEVSVKWTFSAGKDIWRTQGAASHTLSVAAQPIEPKTSSSHELHNFIQEQRKIISTFRSQPWPMQVKLAASRSYKKNLSKYVGHLNTIDTFRDSSSLAFNKGKRLWRAVKQKFTIWSTIIKRIEGKFGTSVASFFSFLRWLCALNILLATLVLCFLVLPQMLVGQGLQVPDSIQGNMSAISLIIDGKGYTFEYSVLFYGYYDSGQNEPYRAPPSNPDPYIGLHYKLPLAYLIVSVGLFVVCGALILSNMAKKFRLLERANIMSDHFLLSWKVFASWDFAITSSKMAKEKRKQITITLKEAIMEAKKKEDSGRNVFYWIVRTFTSCSLFLILGGTSYAIFLAVDNAETVTESSQRLNVMEALMGGWNSIWQLILSFQVQLVIVARNFLLPYLFKGAEFIERFHPRTSLKMMLLRMFVLYFSSLYVLVIALFMLSDNCESTTYCCWETAIGQELYKLTFTHFLADLASIALLDGVRWILHKFFCRQCVKFHTFYNKWVGLAEFQVANNVLKLVYGQALVMFGVLFCPLLVVIGFAKNVILFYARCGAVYYFNKPPQKMFQIASTTNFYMGLLLVTVFMCALPVIYAVVELAPSDSCGPFRGLPNMLNVVVQEVSTWPTVIQTIAGYCQRPTVIVPLLALLFIIIYYYVGHSDALKKANKDLRLQLRVEQNEARERIKRDVVTETIGERVVLNDATQRHMELQQAINSELNDKFQITTLPVVESESVVDASQGMEYPGAPAVALSWVESHQPLACGRQRARRMSARQRPVLPWSISRDSN